MWQSNFSKILLINLAKRQDRMLTASFELYKHQIPFERVEAVEDVRGAYGLFKTLLGVFERAERENWNNILVFEDDSYFLVDNVSGYLEGMTNELKTLDWDLFYLGANVNAPVSKVYNCDYLLSCSMMVSTHALAYSKQGWKLVLQEMRRIVAAKVEMPEPIDMLINRVIQPRGKTFIAFPMLCSQKAGWSDVENRETDYKNLIEDRYNERLKQLV